MFIQKDKMAISESFYVALVIFEEGSPPSLYLISSLEWNRPGRLLVDRHYEGLKSKPEWGLNISNKNKQMLEPFAFNGAIQKLIA